jgi:hypothetical protein
MFDADKLPQFWLLVKNECQNLSDKALKVFLPSVATYLCKTGFSAVAFMKTKY